MDLRANGKTYSSVVFAGHASVLYQASNVGHCPSPLPRTRAPAIVYLTPTIRVPTRSLGNLVVSRDGLSRSSRKKQCHSEVGFPSPSSACGLYLGSALREWEPNSTQGVCGSRSSPPTLLSAVSRSFHRACTVTRSPHRQEVGLTD